MATIIRETEHSQGTGMGTILAVVLFLVALFLLFYYGLPMIRQGGTQFNVPSQIDINLNQNPGQ